MKDEPILIHRDDAAINAHMQALTKMLPRYQNLIKMYNGLKIDLRSKSIPDIIKNAYSECRLQIRKSLPPDLKDTNAVETILLNGETEFINLLTEMRKAGDLHYQNSFALTRSGGVEIDLDSVTRFAQQHCIWATDLRGKELLDKLIDALNDFEMYSAKNYINASLVATALDGGIALNPRWRLAVRDPKTGKLSLNIQTLAMFENSRQK